MADRTYGNFGTISLEVANEVFGVFTDRTKVDTLSTPLEQQKTLERLEEHGVRLVDRAKNLLTGGGKFSEESDNVVGALTIKT